MIVFKFICNWASYCIENRTAQKFYDINQVFQAITNLYNWLLGQQQTVKIKKQFGTNLVQ